MGKIEKFVEKREIEKHKSTVEFINDLLWYVEAMNKAEVEFIETINGINTVFNERMKEHKKETKNA